MTVLYFIVKWVLVRAPNSWEWKTYPVTRNLIADSLRKSIFSMLHCWLLSPSVRRKTWKNNNNKKLERVRKDHFSSTVRQHGVWEYGSFFTLIWPCVFVYMWPCPGWTLPPAAGCRDELHLPLERIRQQKRINVEAEKYLPKVASEVMTSDLFCWTGLLNEVLIYTSTNSSEKDLAN